MYTVDLRAHGAAFIYLEYKQQAVAAPDSEVTHGLKDWLIRIPSRPSHVNVNLGLDNPASTASQLFCSRAFHSSYSMGCLSAAKPLDFPFL